VHALEFYSGYQYSETVEVAVVLCQLGYKVRNDHLVPVPVARSRTRLRDAAIDLAVIPVAAARVWRRDRAPGAFRTDAAAHLSLVAVFGVLLALTHESGTDSPVTFALAAVAALGGGLVLRRAVPRPALALLGGLLALVAAWLVPQRPDAVSAVVLCAVFGVGAALAAPGVRRPRPFVAGAAAALLLAVSVVSTRAVLLALAVASVFAAAAVARFGHVRRPRAHRLRTLALGSALVVAVSALTGYFGASTVGATWFGGGVVHGPRASGEVAITFDADPEAADTGRIVEALDTAGVKATFFVAGKTIDTQPDVVRALLDDGQLVGNHSYHRDEWRWLDPRYPELQRTQDAFAREIGTCPVWFRPPFGQRTPLMARVVKDHGMRMAMWDVSVGDRGTDDPATIAAKVLESARGGSIINLDAGVDRTSPAHRTAIVAALPMIVDGLRARGLEPVRLDELFGGPAYQSCDSARR
jgi:peptidoglycan/xylan/chitin deacetylase (PgdA/CDA1 family)